MRNSVRRRGRRSSRKNKNFQDVYKIGQGEEEEFIPMESEDIGNDEPMEPEEEIRKLKERHKTLKYNFFSMCWIYSLVMLILFLFVWGVLIYVFLHSHNDLEDDIDSLNIRITNLNATGLDGLTPQGLCSFLENDIPIDCLSDVTGTGGSNGDVLMLNSGEWTPMNPDSVCPASCVNGTDGAQGPPGQDGVDGINGTDGINCWDLNENGNCDLPDEDINDDGVCNVTDCQPISGVNGTQGPPGQDGQDGEQGPPGPIVPLCNLTDVECEGVMDLNNTFLQFDSNSSTWNATTISFSDIEVDICQELSFESIDCLGDVDAPSPLFGQYLVGNGTSWVSSELNFDGFVTDICQGDFPNLTISCLSDVTASGPSVGDVLRFDGSSWVDSRIDYADLQGSTEQTALKGIGGGVHFSSRDNQTKVLVPTVMGTVDFSGGEGYLDLSLATDDLNGVVLFTFNGLTAIDYIYQSFYYNNEVGNVVVNFYQYTMAQMNTVGPVAGTLVGGFTTEIAPGYAVTPFLLNFTESPCVVIPQTAGDVYIKSIM